MEPLSLQRDVLYDSVWKRPISHLAKEWNVSPTKIAEACTTMSVPRPPTNHWYVLEIGKASPVLPMPPPGDAPLQVEIPRTQPRRRTEKAAAPPVAVTNTDLVPEHELIEATRAALESGKVGLNGVVTPAANRRHLDIRVTTAQVGPALRAFDAILRRLSGMGAIVDVKRSETSTYTTTIVYDGETIPVFLDERVKRIDIPPPPPPKGTAPDVWEMRMWGRRDAERYRWEASGALTFRLTGLSGTGARQNFGLGGGVAMNDTTEEIARAVVDGTSTLKARRAEAEVQRLKNAEAATRREDRARRQREQEEVVEQMLHIK